MDDTDDILSTVNYSMLSNNEPIDQNLKEDRLVLKQFLAIKCEFFWSHCRVCGLISTSTFNGTNIRFKTVRKVIACHGTIHSYRILVTHQFAFRGVQLPALRVVNP